MHTLMENIHITQYHCDNGAVVVNVTYTRGGIPMSARISTTRAFAFSGVEAYFASMNAQIKPGELAGTEE